MSALDKEQTVTNMQFVGLIEPDLSIRASKKQSFWVTDNLSSFAETYWNWKHGYKSTYSEHFLAKFGFEPSEAGSQVIVNEDELAEYMIGIDPSFTSIIGSNPGMPQIEDTMRFHLQTKYGTAWSNNSKTLIYNDVDHVLTKVAYQEFDYEDDNRDIIIGTLRRADGGGFKEEANNYPVKSEMLTIKYNTSEDPDDWKIYINYASTFPANSTSEKEILMTPIIPMKEDNELALENWDMRRMLNQLNVSGRDFEEALTEVDDDGEEKIDNAYLLNGLPLRNPYEIIARSYSAHNAQYELPAQLIAQIIRDGNTYVEDNGFIDDSIDYITGTESNHTRYVVTEELAAEWYNDHMKEQAYLARALFRTFATYSGIYKEECEDKRSNSRYLGHCVENIVLQGVKTEQEKEEDIIDEYNNYKTPVEEEYAPLISFTMSKLNTTYNFNLSVETFEGKVRPEETDKRKQCTFHFSGSRVGVPDEEGEQDVYETEDSLGYDLLEIKVQIDETHYQVMKITDYTQTFSISGKDFVNSLGSPPMEHRIMVPYYIINKLSFLEWVTVHEHSFCLLVYAIKTVTIAWWKRFASVIITFAVCYFMPALCPAVSTLAAVVTAIVVTLVIEYLVENFSGWWMILVQALYLVWQMINGDFSGIANSEIFLTTAQQVAKLAYSAYELMAAENKIEMEMENQAQENIDEKLAAISGMNSLNVMPKMQMTAHHSFNETNDPGLMYEVMYGAKLYNFDQYYAVTEEIDLRKQVKSG